MLDPAPKGSIQDIAIKVTEEQLINRNIDSKEKTIFVLGSKSVVSDFFSSINHTNIHRKKFSIIVPSSRVRQHSSTIFWIAMNRSNRHWLWNIRSDVVPVRVNLYRNRFATSGNWEVWSIHII